VAARRLQKGTRHLIEPPAVVYGPKKAQGHSKHLYWTLMKVKDHPHDRIHRLSSLPEVRDGGCGSCLGKEKRAAGFWSSNRLSFFLISFPSIFL